MPPVDTARVAALVFDNDGTLVDSEPVNLLAWQAAAHEYGVAIDAGWYATRTGLSAELLLDDLDALTGRALPRDAMSAAHAVAYAGALGALAPRADVAAVAVAQHGRRPLAVCSGARRAQVEAGLRRVGLLALFDAVVCAEDAARPKPAPDLYLATAERLRVAPAACLAFEDTEQGLASARDAGMQAIDVTGSELAAVAARLT